MYAEPTNNKYPQIAKDTFIHGLGFQYQFQVR